MVFSHPLSQNLGVHTNNHHCHTHKKYLLTQKIFSTCWKNICSHSHSSLLLLIHCFHCVYFLSDLDSTHLFVDISITFNTTANSLFIFAFELPIIFHIWLYNFWFLCLSDCQLRLMSWKQFQPISSSLDNPWKSHKSY